MKIHIISKSEVQKWTREIINQQIAGIAKRIRKEIYREPIQATLGEKLLPEESVGRLGLYARAANALANLDIKTIGQLQQETEQTLLRARNFGNKSLNEIKDKMRFHGIELKK